MLIVESSSNHNDRIRPFLSGQTICYARAVAVFILMLSLLVSRHFRFVFGSHFISPLTSCSVFQELDQRLRHEFRLFLLHEVAAVLDFDQLKISGFGSHRCF